MVDVVSKRCGEEGCFKHPSFGVASSRKAEFCAAHARAGMVDVVSKRCGEEGCFKRPSFGAASSRKAEFCAAHARAGMVNVRSKRCGEEGCFKKTSFNVASSRKAEFCAAHARAGMVNVKSKRCGNESCSTQPSFGKVGSIKVEFCATHANAGVVFMDGNAEASQRSSNGMREQGNSHHPGARDLTMASDAAGRVREGIYLNDDSAVGETGVAIHRRGGKSNHSSGRGFNTHDRGRNVDSRRSSRAIHVGRRGANSATISPATWRQSPGVAAADGVPFDGAETHMKTKVETTVAPARGFEGMRTSKLVTARSSNCDGMSRGGSSNITRNASCDGIITNGRGTKRLRRTAQVEPVVDAETEDSMMSEKKGNDMKFESDVCVPCLHVSAALSRPRAR
ncbi:unnamed protein product [Sphacelaria rigidula]